MTEPQEPEREISEPDSEQGAIWAAELERRNEGSGHGNPQRHHEQHTATKSRPTPEQE